MIRALALCAALLAAAPAAAVQPDEILPDPALEARAREISSGLRCLVCRNESIDDSNADFAKTMRLLVRERLLAGDSDGQVRDYVVDRYGEYVLLAPRLTVANALIWGAGPGLLLLGGWMAWRFLRARERAAAGRPPPAPLTEDEEARLARLLDR
jgi:cytochrome c-type biogenesis protein CcmH